MSILDMKVNDRAQTPLWRMGASDIGEQGGLVGLRGGGVILAHLERDSPYATCLLLTGKRYPVWPELKSFPDNLEI